MSGKKETVAVFLDDSDEPILEGRPPAALKLDTNSLDDGAHFLRVEAWDSAGVRGVRQLPFQVRNGPAIVVSGLDADSVVHGHLSMVVHAYGEGPQDQFEPELAEVPAPVPTWAWVLFIAVIAWALFYLVDSSRNEHSQSYVPLTIFIERTVFGATPKSMRSSLAPQFLGAAPTCGEAPACELSMTS